tara:strand:- start:7363 stop:7941 length:579 start_codon:yes stop_codon:yes gene_type:complete
MGKTFYVCSYGGSGSKMICAALRKYGKVKHIHSRKPPNKLEYIGKEKGGDTYYEWFNGIVVPEDELKDIYVIYIYRNPSFCIPSRFKTRQHLKHIQANTSIKLKDVLTCNKDLYDIRGFYDNYVKINEKRNYKIYCVKYEEIFDKKDELSTLLGIGPLHLENKSSRESHKDLDRVYDDLIEEMNNNEFIIIR